MMCSGRCAHLLNSVRLSVTSSISLSNKCNYVQYCKYSISYFWGGGEVRLERMQTHWTRNVLLVSYLVSSFQCPVLCNVLCGVVLCGAVLCGVMLCCAVRCCAV